MNQQLRHPFAVLGQNLHNAKNVMVQSQVNNVKEVSNDGKSPRADNSWHWHLCFCCQTEEVLKQSLSFPCLLPTRNRQILDELVFIEKCWNSS